MGNLGTLVNAAVTIGIVFAAFIAIGLIFARLYKRATKEISFVRTGLGGQEVIMDGGAIVLPVVHDTIPVNMNTLRLEIARANEDALITLDRMRVDVKAEFYVRVQPTKEAVSSAAQTLGTKTMQPEVLKQLVEGKFVDALRSVAAEMQMVDLHEQRSEFVQKVQKVVAEDILKNGLELESVSLTGLDQTRKEYFNPDNAFDAEGLTRLTEEIEARKKKRNDIEQETAVQIQSKNLEATQQSLALEKEEEYAKLAQQREIEIRKASQAAEIAKEQAAQDQNAKQAQIKSAENVKLSEITAQKAVEEQKIAKEQTVRELEIRKTEALETAGIRQRKSVELADQDRAIAIAQKTEEQAAAQARADEARALSVAAEEKVLTARETEVAERQKQVELIEAKKVAERAAIDVTVGAEAAKQAAEDEAEAARLKARGDADAVQLQAEADEKRYAVEAQGKLELNQAQNTLSAEQIARQIKLALIEALPRIIEQSVKPMENIDGIKIMQVAGLTGNAGTDNGNGAGAGANSNLGDQMVRSALQYRAQAPLVDGLLKELGVTDSGLPGLLREATSAGLELDGAAAASEAPMADGAGVTEPAPADSGDTETV